MRIVVLPWPDTFEDWYTPLGLDRTDFLDGYDGEWTIAAADALRKAGAEVHVVYVTRGDEGRARQQPSGAIIHFVRASPGFRLLWRATWGHRYWERTAKVWTVAPLFSTASRRLLTTIRDLRPDTVVVQDYESLRFDVAVLLLRALGLRVVGIDTGGSAHPSRSVTKRWTTALAARLLATHAQEARRARETLGHRDVAVWPLPIRTDVHVPVDRAAARASLGVGATERIVVSVGRLHPVKGLDDLVDACRGLDCRLVLVGSGSERDRLAARGGDTVWMTGRLPSTEVARWYAAADVVALSSRREGQPAVVLEAYSCARAVVATAVGGVPDVVLPGRTGWLVPAHDVAALRRALDEALRDPARTDAYGAEGRRRVVATHSLASAGEELLSLLDVGSAARRQGSAR